jgi:hypothetical protein
VKFPGRKKAVGVAVGAVILILVGYRLFWYAPAVQVVVVKQMEITGKIQGPGTVQS